MLQFGLSSSSASDLHILFSVVQLSPYPSYSNVKWPRRRYSNLNTEFYDVTGGRGIRDYLNCISQKFPLAY